MQGLGTITTLLKWISLLPFAFPFVWMFATSFKRHADIIQFPPTLLFEPTLSNYRDVFVENPLFHYLVNSLVVGVGSTVLSLALGLPAAYTIARCRQKIFAIVILVARLVPGIACLVPWYMIFRAMGLLDSHLALILTHIIISLPVVVWLMIGFFEDLPVELEEAARVDGCSRFVTFWRIAIPLVRPGIFAASILAFIYSWNNFLFSLILSGENTATLPVAAFSFITYGMINWGGLTAAATVILLPVAFLTLLVQRHIVQGLTAGATKG